MPDAASINVKCLAFPDQPFAKMPKNTMRKNVTDDITGKIQSARKGRC
ncbi:MAG: hypothetical protein BWY17_04936 [Deltaproteobacteria bacterium ADurb.Bin207]|nr:MAG: hypothetical protein BWY17_04936 [Deltaproteobacteria bacterium ADurb.Bin207]